MQGDSDSQSDFTDLPGGSAAQRPALLYTSLADEFADSIARGVLKPGDKLPSLRKVAAQRQLSLSTVIEAFRVLEDRGLVEAKPQAGFFVRKRPTPRTEQPRSHDRCCEASGVVVNRLLYQRISSRSPQASFGYAILSPDHFPNLQLQRMMSNLSRRHPELLSDYGTPEGDLGLRRQIARRSLDWGGRIDASEIMITSGGIEALSLCLRATTEPGDVVAIESPCYFGLLQILESLKLKALEIPTDLKTGISVEALDFATRHGDVKAVVLMPNFSNPLGCLMPDSHKQRVVEMLDRRGIPLIEDDIYGEFYYGDQRPLPAKAFDRSGNVLLCSSFTKVLAPGMRVGSVVGGRYQTQLRNLKYINTFSTPVVLQQTTALFLASGGFDHHMRKLRKACAEQLRAVADAVQRHFPAGTRINEPSGGYILWVELPEMVDCIALVEAAANEGISFAPGTLFSATQRDYRNCMRLCCGVRWNAERDREIARLGQLASEQLQRQQDAAQPVSPVAV